MASTLELWLLATQNLRPVQIGSSSITGTQASVTLSVPTNTYSAIQVAYTARSDLANSATYMTIRFNGDSTNNYLWQINQANNASLSGSGNSGAATNLIQIGTMPAATATANYFGTGQFVIGNPSSSVFKPASGQSSSMITTTNSYSGTYGGIWLSTAVITSITFLPASGNFVAGSAITVYGLP